MDRWVGILLDHLRELGQQFLAIVAQRTGQPFPEDPYQQLEFMSNILRGTPMGTTTSLYSPAPSALSQLAGAGTALYGASQLMKDGGVPGLSIALLRDGETINIDAEGCSGQSSGRSADHGFFHFDLCCLANVVASTSARFQVQMMTAR